MKEIYYLLIAIIISVCFFFVLKYTLIPYENKTYFNDLQETQRNCNIITPPTNKEGHEHRYIDILTGDTVTTIHATVSPKILMTLDSGGKTIDLKPIKLQGNTGQSLFD